MVCATCVNVNSVFGRLDPEVPVLNLGSQFRDLLRAIGKRLAVVELQQCTTVALRQAIILARGKHDTARGIVLLKCAACVRTYLHYEHVLYSELGTNPKQRRSNAATVCIRQFGEIAGAHEDFRLRQLPPQLGIARKRGHEAEMNGIEDWIEDRLNAALGSTLCRPQERIEVSVTRRHQHWRGSCFRGEIERALVETEQELSACQSARPKFFAFGRIDADRKILSAQSAHRIL